MKADDEWITAWQSLAWIAWRSDAAMDYFSVNGEIKWNEAKRGQWPKRLGKPRMALAEAERQLDVAIETKAINAQRIS